MQVGDQLDADLSFARLEMQREEWSNAEGADM
jgi:hypothetical protein